MQMLKVKPHPDYPTEEGRYLRGNDFSPVAVAIILNQDGDKIPRDIQALVQAGLESGAALSGTIQTPNVGFEKMICNLVANPNIRYLILGGPESAGHLTGEALKALFRNGVDAKKRIVGTEAAHAALFNLPQEVIERFLKQISLLDLQFEGDPEVIRKAVWSCYQENRVAFRDYTLGDPGAYPEPPLGDRITWQVTQPWAVPVDEGELSAKKKAEELMARLRARSGPKEGN
ncbi:MAG: tetrahydromethanopterin S-methyltransferase subunit A [Deltaproteobacteria bacterium]|nr:tetrahydromethanopterin S-methyltransferase subunit A [Deltaproteobacteria bacterium]